MRLELLEGRYAVCRLDRAAPGPAAHLEMAGFFSVTRTDNELSVICEEHQAPAAGPGCRAETGFRLLRVAGPLPFDAVGILASLSAALAAAKVSLLAISTYDTDYLLVRQADLETALAALRLAGHEMG